MAKTSKRKLLKIRVTEKQGLGEPETKLISADELKKNEEAKNG